MRLGRGCCCGGRALSGVVRPLSVCGGYVESSVEFSGSVARVRQRLCLRSVQGRRGLSPVRKRSLSILRPPVGPLCRPHIRRAAAVCITRLRIRACRNQRPRRRFVSAKRRMQKGCATVLICGVHVRAGGEQKCDKVSIASISRPEQRCSAACVACRVWCDAFGQQLCDARCVPGFDASQQRIRLQRIGGERCGTTRRQRAVHRPCTQVNTGNAKLQ